MKAYWDTFSGLIPCKVTRVFNESEHYGKKVEFILTANHGPYKRGEVHTSSALFVCPRDAVHVRSGQYRIAFWRGCDPRCAKDRDRPSDPQEKAMQGEKAMAWKSHWQPKSPKADWAQDCRDYLQELTGYEHQFPSLDLMTRGDLMTLAEVLSNAVEAKKLLKLARAKAEGK